jgi:catechol-2,3-dioxygenase
MLAGKSGLALFPMKSDSPEVLNPGKSYITMKHFAFNVDHENFELAKQKLDQLHIPFEYQDHVFFDSIYFYDPDGYQVELTMIKVKEESFYK